MRRMYRSAPTYVRSIIRNQISLRSLLSICMQFFFRLFFSTKGFHNTYYDYRYGTVRYLYGTRVPYFFQIPVPYLKYYFHFKKYIRYLLSRSLFFYHFYRFVVVVVVVFFLKKIHSVCKVYQRYS